MSENTDNGPDLDPDDPIHQITNMKHRMFVFEYCIDQIATQAAIRAGYSPRTAGQQGSRLLKNANISDAIQYRLSGMMKDRQVTAERVISQIALHAFGNMQDMFDEEGRLLPIQDMPREVASQLAALDVTRRDFDDGSVEFLSKVKKSDSLKALEMLAKHLKVIKDEEPDEMDEAERIAKIGRILSVAANREGNTDD